MRRLFLPFALLVFAAGTARPAAAAGPYDLSPEGNARFLADFAALPGITKLADGVMVRVVESGKGPSPLGRQDTVEVEYRGWMVDGKIFDQTKPSQPHAFQLANLIPGWTAALLKMKTGDQWQIVIPADQAYGAEGRPPVIPPNQTLVFMVKLDQVAFSP